MTWNYLLCFTIPLALSLLLTPAMRKAALAIGLLDHPSEKKFHITSMPLLGGAAIAISFALTAILNPRINTAPWLNPVMAASIIMLLLGLVDDFKPLPGKAKLIVQLVAATQLIACGVHYNAFGFKPLDYTLTAIVFIAIVNGVNTIDIEDGQAAGLTAIAAFFMFAASLAAGEIQLAYFCAILCGAITGFLFFNFHPASIFAGDAGSMFTGSLIACAAIIYPEGKRFVHHLVPIIILWTLPFDIGMILISRLTAKRKFFQNARDHTTHRLQNLGIGTSASVLTIYAIALFSGLAGILMTSLTGREASMVLMSIIFTTLTAWFLLKDLCEYD